MTLKAFLDAVDVGKVRYQMLRNCIREAKTNAKKVTKITFETEEVSANDFVFSGERATKIGIILWIPIEEYEKHRPKEGAKS